MNAPTGWHADDALLARYVGGLVGAAQAASVELHVLGCGDCRARLAGHVDLPGLEAVWDRVRDQVETPRLPLLVRLLVRLRLAEPDIVVLAAASSLRTAWLGGIGVVLGFAAVAAWFGGDDGLVLFLLVAPLVPVAGVVAAYGPRVDPLHEISSVAPYSPARRLLLRTCAVLASSLPPAVLLGLLLPGPLWLAAAWLLPAVACVLVVLAVSTWLEPVAVGCGVALAWALVAGLAAARRAPLAPVEPAAQPAYLVLAALALGTLLTRVRNPDNLRRIS